MTPAPRVVASLVAGLLLAFAARAHAGNERVAIAYFAVTGQPLADEAQAKLKQSLRGGLAAANFEVVPDADVQRAIITSGVAGCDTVSCLRKIGDLVMAKRVIKATVEVVGNTHVASTLELIDLADGKIVANAKDNCDVCTMKEVNDGLSNAAAALRMQLEPGQPPPAPPSGVALAATPDRPSHRTLYIGLAAASGALFIASVATLVISGAYHGRNSCSSPTAGERCPTRYNGTPGIVIGAIGAPLFGVAAALLAYKAYKSPPSRVALIPSIGPGAAALDLHIHW